MLDLCRSINYVSKYSNLKLLQARGPSRKNSVVKELLNSFQLFALAEHTFRPMMMEQVLTRWMISTIMGLGPSYQP
jgi:hypothetical protein